VRIATVAFVLLLMKPCLAAPITYGFTENPDSQGRTAFGTITTDGRLGALLPSDILGWAYTITDPNGNFFGGHSDGVSFLATDFGTTITILGTLEASANFLYLPTPPTPVGNDSALLNELDLDVQDGARSMNFNNDAYTPSGGPTFWVQSTLLDILLNGNDSPTYEKSVQLNVPMPQLIIATAVSAPEPSSIMLAVFGIAGLLTSRWRKA
jgi:hypothetical protein